MKQQSGMCTVRVSSAVRPTSLMRSSVKNSFIAGEGTTDVRSRYSSTIAPTSAKRRCFPEFSAAKLEDSAVVAALFAEGRQLRGVERARITFEIAPDLAQWETEITEMIRKAGDVGRQLIEIISLHARGLFAQIISGPDYVVITDDYAVADQLLKIIDGAA